eukprot:Hpha_TRINITY_DN15826_c1_g1::TRINITY_DN15826_c1_g1_i2::g.190078::m.190078
MYTSPGSAVSTFVATEPVAGFRDVNIARTEWPRYGVKLDDSCRVLYVGPGSPAARDGIRVGNAVVGVDGALVRSRDDFAREWMRGHSAHHVALSFDQRVDDQPPPLPPEIGGGGAGRAAARAVNVTPSRLFFPAKALKRDRPVVNTVTLSNCSTREHLFVFRSSHPADVVVRQREGILAPCGSEANTTVVEVVWSPSKSYDFARPDWGPLSTEYPQLHPPRQPVVTVVVWERGAGLQLSTVPAECRTETELPVSFTRPVQGVDDFDFSVAGQLFRSSEGDTCSALSATVSSVSSPGKVMFHQQLLSNERERADFRRSRERATDAVGSSVGGVPSVASFVSAGGSSLSALDVYADTERDEAARQMRLKDQEVRELRQEVTDLRRQLVGIQSIPPPPPPEKPAESMCVVL